MNKSHAATDTAAYLGIILVMVFLVWCPCRPMTRIWDFIWQFAFLCGLVVYSSIVTLVYVLELSGKEDDDVQKDEKSG